jgi:plasmid replication initiation protein
VRFSSASRRVTCVARWLRLTPQPNAENVTRPAARSPGVTFTMTMTAIVTLTDPAAASVTFSERSAATSAAQDHAGNPTETKTRTTPTSAPQADDELLSLNSRSPHGRGAPNERAERHER